MGKKKEGMQPPSKEWIKGGSGLCSVNFYLHCFNIPCKRYSTIYIHVIHCYLAKQIYFYMNYFLFFDMEFFYQKQFLKKKNDFMACICILDFDFKKNIFFISNYNICISTLWFHTSFHKSSCMYNFVHSKTRVFNS